jgi:hypothetical protein
MLVYRVLPKLPDGIVWEAAAGIAQRVDQMTAGPLQIPPRQSHPSRAGSFGGALVAGATAAGYTAADPEAIPATGSPPARRSQMATGQATPTSAIWGNLENIYSL